MQFHPQSLLQDCTVQLSELPRTQQDYLLTPTDLSFPPSTLEYGQRHIK